ncbi:membrane metalloprotease [Ulvibacter sp. MAR_2010_11]|uniref:membrane metalloprotease n=1 Tax=Ulvibacter sp. MAR_2010_11 TaxID=1250229 RepID=UPI001E3DD859|nr:membrane metalloprotease [Ulvibacter sp. MAR_2010_11]
MIILLAIVTIAACKKDDGDNPTTDPKAENRKALGTSAEDILSEDIYTKLTVEIVYSGGFRPTDATIVGLQNFLNQRVNKPEGISINETFIDAPAGAPFTIEEIRAIEEEHRTIYTVDNSIAIYIFFANGSNAGDTSTTVTLGSAYRNTSIVVYEKTIRDLANNSANIDLTELELSTLTHEFGHIFGLVNIQSDDIHTSHEDTAHLKHCMVEDCLMYFESTNGLLLVELLENRRPVPGFDPLCIADLQAKGGK